jgi:hypothetical protein
MKTANQEPHKITKTNKKSPAGWAELWVFLMKRPALPEFSLGNNSRNDRGRGRVLGHNVEYRIGKIRWVNCGNYVSDSSVRRYIGPIHISIFQPNL